MIRVLFSPELLFVDGVFPLLFFFVSFNGSRGPLVVLIFLDAFLSYVHDDLLTSANNRLSHPPPFRLETGFFQVS